MASISEHPDPAERTSLLGDLTDGCGTDVLFEFTGNSRAMAEGVALAAPKTRYVMGGTLDGPAEPLAATAMLRKDLTAAGSWGDDWSLRAGA